jgi:hypothetical protein
VKVLFHDFGRFRLVDKEALRRFACLMQTWEKFADLRPFAGNDARIDHRRNRILMGRKPAGNEAYPSGGKNYFLKREECPPTP